MKAKITSALQAALLLLLLITVATPSFAQAVSDSPKADDVVVQHVNASDAAKLINENPDYIILDVRTPLEYKYSQIENAININYYSLSFKESLEQLDKNKTYIVHCHSGVRSGKTLPIMLSAGFKHIIHMDGGMKAWKQAKLPVH